MLGIKLRAEYAWTQRYIVFYVSSMKCNDNQLSHCLQSKCRHLASNSLRQLHPIYLLWDILVDLAFKGPIWINIDAEILAKWTQLVRTGWCLSWQCWQVLLDQSFCLHAGKVSERKTKSVSGNDRLFLWLLLRQIAGLLKDNEKIHASPAAAPSDDDSEIKKIKKVKNLI